MKFGFCESQFQDSTTIRTFLAIDKREVLLAEDFHDIIDVIWSVILEPYAEIIVLDFVRFAENFNALEILHVDGDLPGLLPVLGFYHGFWSDFFPACFRSFACSRFRYSNRAYRDLRHKYRLCAVFLTPGCD